MTQLGNSYGGFGAPIISHVTHLNQLSINSIVRNGCTTDDPLDQGVYFIRGEYDNWYPYDVKRNSVVKREDLAFKGEQLFLPVEHVFPSRLTKFRDELRFVDQVVNPVRKKFEETLGIDGYYRRDPGAEDCLCYDEHCECFDDDFTQVVTTKVDAAWLAAAKQIREHATLEV